MRKSAFCICENREADQLHGNGESDQRLCFRYTDSTIPLLPKSEISIHFMWLYSPVCVGSGRKPRRPVFSQRGSLNAQGISTSRSSGGLYQHENPTLISTFELD